MSKDSCAESLARDCVKARFELRRAAQVLHDQVGSSLTAAGMRLQLLRMEHPETENGVAAISQALEGAMDKVRTLARELEPSPVRRTGLKNALRDLAAAAPPPAHGKDAGGTNGRGIALRYTATAVVPAEIADALYHAIASSASSASRNARVVISVSGSRSIAARVSYDGRPRNRGRELTAAALLAGHAGLEYKIKPFCFGTKQGTIVAIRYGNRRSSGG